MLLAGVWFYLKRKKSASAATVTSSSASATGAYGVDYSGELSVIQTEVEALLAAEGQEPAGGTGTSGSGTGTTTGTTPPPAGGTGTKTATKTAAPAMPSGVHATKTTSNSVTLAWNKSANATGYRVRTTYQSKVVGSPASVTGTSATISGLTADHTYTFHVAATGPGGTSAETNGPAVKTSR